jgi:hypothetical protein
MKAILEFNLPEDQADYHIHFQSNNMYISLYEMQEFLRQKTKYANDDVSDEALNAYEECREYFNQVLDDNDVSLEI